MSDVGIICFKKKLGNGVSTFTAHLYRALQAAGHRPIMYRLGYKRSNIFEGVHQQQFGDYAGVFAYHVQPKTMFEMVDSMPTIISAATSLDLLPDPQMMARLIRKGARIVVHDSTQLKLHGKRPAFDNPILIRPALLDRFPKGVFIPHPYMRSRKNVAHAKTKNAVSITRVHNSKRSQHIVRANSMLPKKLRCALLGQEFRLFSFGIQKRWPGIYKQSGKSLQFPLTFEAPVELCEKALYNVDLTKFVGDGGGTQYAQLEAMDAGCCNVMHVDWFNVKGELKPNIHAIPVNDAADLAEVLRGSRSGDRKHIIENGYKLLKRHDPKLIGKLYAKELGL